MKKLLVILLSLILSILCISCNNNNNKEISSSKDNKTSNQNAISQGEENTSSKKASETEEELAKKYNDEYPDISGRTVADVAEDAGMYLEDFLKAYGLPEDMPGSVNENAAYNNIPCRVIAEIYGMTFEELKEVAHLPEHITEETPCGKIMSYLLK